MKPPTFVFVDCNCQPVTVVDDRVRRLSMPMSPPVFEVVLSVAIDGKIRRFQGTSVRGEEEARRAARRDMQLYLKKNARVGVELS